MNIYVTGPNGHVGKELIKLGCKPLVCDVTDYDAVHRAFDELPSKPDVVINLASKSDPDFCGKKENEKLVIATNLRGAYNVALASEKFDVPVLLMSTDHIFDGKHGPYGEDAKLSAHPANFYGMTKLSMEAMSYGFYNVRVVRTSCLFALEKLRTPLNDYPTFINRSFMYLPHFAHALYQYALMMSNIVILPKILHISGSETVSWYELALAYASVFKLPKDNINPRRKEIKNFAGAPRPHKAGLKVGLSKKLGLPQYSYLDGLHQMYEDKLKGELGY